MGVDDDSSGCGIEPKQEPQEAMDAIGGIGDQYDEYVNRNDAGAGADSQQDCMGDKERDKPDELQELEANVAAQGQLVGDNTKPTPMDGNAESIDVTKAPNFNFGMRQRCTSCNLFKVNLDYSKTQLKKFAQGKGGRCRWCIEHRMKLKQPKVDITTQRAVNTETAGCEDMEATKKPKEEMPEASWLTLGEEEDCENLEEIKESDERVCAKERECVKPKDKDYEVRYQWRQTAYAGDCLADFAEEYLEETKETKKKPRNPVLDYTASFWDD